VSSGVKRGEVYYTTLPDRGRGIQSGIRPVVVISNDIGNHFSNVVIVAPVTSKRKTNLPTHTTITLDKKSTILCEQLTTVHKSKLYNKIHTLTETELTALDNALRASIGIDQKEAI